MIVTANRTIQDKTNDIIGFMSMKFVLYYYLRPLKFVSLWILRNVMESELKKLVDRRSYFYILYE